MTKQAITALIALTIVGVGAGVAWASSNSASTANAPSGNDIEPFTFEIAENATRFAFDDAPVFDDGMPAYGNPFVTQGYIYEQATLADGGGVNPDGSPTHPEAVIGTWICEGVLIGDGARTVSGPWVVSTQVFDFDAFDGFDAVVTHGVETPVVGEPVERAVIGGTGSHAGAAGKQIQALEGFNGSGGVNLTVTLIPENGS